MHGADAVTALAADSFRSLPLEADARVDIDRPERVKDTARIYCSSLLEQPSGTDYQDLAGPTVEKRSTAGSKDDQALIPGQYPTMTTGALVPDESRSIRVLKDRAAVSLLGGNSRESKRASRDGGTALDWFGGLDAEGVFLPQAGSAVDVVPDWARESPAMDVGGRASGGVTWGQAHSSGGAVLAM